MRDYKNLSHTRWDFKYHIVFIPNKRQEFIYSAGAVLRYADGKDDSFCRWARAITQQHK